MRTHFVVFLALAAFVVGLAAPATAQTPADAANPYEGRVTVSDQSGATRDQALREALAQVVARVSGQASVASAAPVISRASQYVQRYGFTQDGGNGLQLVASFDQTAVDAQLRALGLPVWGYSSAPAEDLALTVSNIRSSADYAKVLSTLRAVPGVKNISVVGSEADRLQLTLRAEGGAARINSALAAGRVLVADSTATPGTLSLRLAR